MRELPSGTLTLLFSDIQGSTVLLRELGSAYGEILEMHRTIVREGFGSANGIEVDASGDSFFVAFQDASDAVRAALQIQRSLGSHSWPKPGLRVRMGLHTGAVASSEGSYVGLAVHEAARIMGAAHGGQVLISDVTRSLADPDALTDAAFRDVGEHHLKDFDAPRRLYQLAHPDLEESFPELRTDRVTADSLPTELTSFIGRESEILEIAKQIVSGRLVTLTGTGGVGKTRLAIRSATAVSESFGDGTWFVNLAPVSDETMVAPTIASVLGVREAAGQSLENVIADAIGRRRMLIVLDNCEHLLEPCGLVTKTLLERCPSLTFLATSREPLGLPGEIVRRVSSLRIDGDETNDLGDAARLFVERAMAADSDFELEPSDHVHVEAICQQLDGIPLAIELAAAHVRSLSCAEILERLQDQFRLLTGGARLGLERHRTLRALVDWSYALLEKPEQMLLSRLGVFASTFSLAAAEGVAAGDGLHDILPSLERLVDKSLVLRERGAGKGVRFRLLETIRQYAVEKLIEAGESENVRRAHRDFFLALAQQAGPELLTGNQAEWIRRIDTDLDNIRAAIEWSIHAPGEAENALRIANPLARYWDIRALWSEAVNSVSVALAAAEDAPLSLRAESLITLLFPAISMGAALPVDLAQRTIHEARSSGDALARARCVVAEAYVRPHERAELMREAIEIARTVGNEALLLRFLAVEGFIAIGTGDHEFGIASTLEASKLARSTNDWWALAVTLDNLGWCASERGEHEQAQMYWKESLELYERVGDWVQQAEVKRELGDAAWTRGDLAAGEALLRESLVSMQRAGYITRVVFILANLAQIAILRADTVSARDYLEQARDVAGQSPDALGAMHHGLGRLGLAEGNASDAEAQFRLGLDHATRAVMAPALEGLCVLGLAETATAQPTPDFPLAARMLGAADVHFRERGIILDPVRQSDFDHVQTIVRDALGEEFEALFDRGRFSLPNPALPESS